MSARHSPRDHFVAIELRADDRDAAERAAAEGFAAGAVGLEERETSAAVTFDVYAPAARAGPVRAALAAEGVRVGRAVPVPDVDWAERWKDSLAAFSISPRLLLRPSFDTTPARPGQRVLVIDPGQAFGTGGHESTRLALACIDANAAAIARARVLDVGTGTGVLALASLALGCPRVCAFDLDPLAGEAARTNAARNDLSVGLDLFVGELPALSAAARFDWVFANLLLAELEPLTPVLAQHTPIGGRWIVSGLIAPQREGFEARAAAQGLHTESVRRQVDASGVTWIALVMRRGPGRTSPGTGGRG